MLWPPNMILTCRFRCKATLSPEVKQIISYEVLSLLRKASTPGLLCVIQPRACCKDICRSAIRPSLRKHKTGEDGLHQIQCAQASRPNQVSTFAAEGHHCRLSSLELGAVSLGDRHEVLILHAAARKYFYYRLILMSKTFNRMP
jgi:hypothetical protein